MQPYTYLIKFKPTNQYYYGVRSANKLPPSDDLMKKYFTSSRYIKTLIKEYGVEQFEWEIRKIFSNSDSASRWESKVLRRCRVLEKDIWLNRNINGKLAAGPKHPLYGIPCTPERARKIGLANKGKPSKKKGIPMSEEQKQKLRKPRSEETKQLIRAARAKQVMKPKSAATKEKIRLGNLGKNKGKIRSIETRNKMSESLKGKKKSIESSNKKQKTLLQLVQNGTHHSLIKIKCEFCNRFFNKLLYSRWHGVKCKANLQ